MRQVTHAVNQAGKWTYPEGMVFVKHFEIELRRDNLTIEFHGLGSRQVRIWRSPDLVNWALWDVRLNSGIPLNPALLFQFTDPMDDAAGFFKFEVKEN